MIDNIILARVKYKSNNCGIRELCSILNKYFYRYVIYFNDEDILLYENLLEYKNDIWLYNIIIIDEVTAKNLCPQNLWKILKKIRFFVEKFDKDVDD